MTGAFALIFAAASLLQAGAYDCALDAPQQLYLGDSGPELRKLNFPDLTKDDWSFRAEIDPSFGIRITPLKADPLGIKGQHGLMSTSVNSFVMATYASKGCVLTDGGCATVVQIVAQPDKSLKLSALPAAIMYFDDEKIPEPFNAISEGKCVLSKPSK